MKDDDFEYENQRELDEILFSMTSEEFLESELESQLGEEIFSKNKNDYLKLYISKFKLYKKEYSENLEFIDSLKERKVTVVNYIIDEIADKFNLTIDEDSRTTKMAKTLYSFFVIDYFDNLKTLFLTYINNNKKSIITQIKKERRRKDISSSASKIRLNGNDTIIIDNISYIINNIILSEDITDYISIIAAQDDSVDNLKIIDYLQEEKITPDDDSYQAFIQPYDDEESGWSDIISDIVIELNGDADKNEIDIFKNDDEEENEE